MLVEHNTSTKRSENKSGNKCQNEALSDLFSKLLQVGHRFFFFFKAEAEIII